MTTSADGHGAVTLQPACVHCGQSEAGPLPCGVNGTGTVIQGGGEPVVSGSHNVPGSATGRQPPFSRP